MSGVTVMVTLSNQTYSVMVDIPLPLLSLLLSFPPSPPPTIAHSGTVEVTEASLLRDIIFVFQNIEGDYIHFDRKQEAYRIDEKVRL